MAAAGVTGRQPSHAWRHSSATELLALGVDVATVAGRLGHSSPRTTLAIYCHTTPARDQAAAAALAALVG